jgi:hypothetical protein
MSSNRRARVFVAAAVAAALWLPAARGLAARSQTSAPPPPQTAPAQSSQDLERIKAALARPNTLILTDSQVRFYVEVRERWPSVEDMFRGVDLINGPSKRGAPMTHNEYLSMVTPREMVAVTNWIGQMLVRKALEEIRNARDENEIQKIRERIDRELAALIGRGGR